MYFNTRYALELRREIFVYFFVPNKLYNTVIKKAHTLYLNYIIIL